MDPEVGDLIGDILINGELIEAIGPDLPVDEAAVEVIDAADTIVVPGFIDTHRHMYQALLRGLASDWSLVQYVVASNTRLGPELTPDDLYLGNKLGALDALDAGVTSVFDWSHAQESPDHTDELIRGLRDAGIRATFGYGGGLAEYRECLAPPFRSTKLSNAAELRRLRNGEFSSDTGLLTLGLAARGPDMSVMEVVRDDWALARELGIRINAHVGQGIFPGRPAVLPLYEAGLLGDDVTFGHCNLLTGEEMRLMAESGVTATVTPEDELNMGHGHPPILELMRAGIRPNIGTDTCIAVGGDQFTAMRFALAAPRARVNAAQLDAGENPWDLQLSVRDVLAMATIEGARALGQADRIGSLAPGKQADLVVINAADVSMTPVHNPVAAVVHHASRSTVRDVFVAGTRVKRDGRLVGVDQAAVHRDASTAAEALRERTGVKPGWVPEALG
jgi:cytosine/adenosine deaminase-related metal-dependent hydrolase